MKNRTTTTKRAPRRGRSSMMFFVLLRVRTFKWWLAIPTLILLVVFPTLSALIVSKIHCFSRDQDMWLSGVTTICCSGRRYLSVPKELRGHTTGTLG